MKINCQWKEKMVFEASDSEGRKAQMDASPPIGQGIALTPKGLMLAGLAGCTAMDVVAFLRKKRQTLDSFDIEVDAKSSEGGYPAVYTDAKLIFRLKGEIDPAAAEEAVRLSQTRYCGVSAMLSKALPIHYVVELNGQQIATGEAHF